MKCALKFSCKGAPNIFLLKVNYLDEIIKTLMKNDRPLSDVKKKTNIILLSTLDREIFRAELITGFAHFCHFSEIKCVPDKCFSSIRKY